MTERKPPMETATYVECCGDCPLQCTMQQISLCLHPKARYMAYDEFVSDRVNRHITVGSGLPRWCPLRQARLVIMPRFRG